MKEQSVVQLASMNSQERFRHKEKKNTKNGPFSYSFISLTTILLTSLHVY